MKKVSVYRNKQAGSHTSSRLYLSRRQVLGRMPIESFTGIKYFNIILLEWTTEYMSSIMKKMMHNFNVVQDNVQGERIQEKHYLIFNEFFDD